MENGAREERDGGVRVENEAQTRRAAHRVVQKLLDARADVTLPVLSFLEVALAEKIGEQERVVGGCAGDIGCGAEEGTDRYRQEGVCDRCGRYDQALLATDAIE